MRIPEFLAAVGVGGLLVTGSIFQVALPAEKGGTARLYGIETRVPWTTSNIKGTPDPPAPYRIERAFPKLKFTEPLALTRAPGTDRLFVAERYGKIFSFPNTPQAEKADLFLDLGNVVYGLAFHPQFSKNGYVYVSYIIDPKEELPRGTHLSRFQVSRDDPFRCDKSTEKLLLEWPSGGHNGGCLKFGPDGYLYIATGDSSGFADEYQTGQDISNLPASVLRIDVDRSDDGKAYGIPKDNPFVGVPGARGEIWAYGLRQVWKMSFDRVTGDLWGGNVGQDLWEMVVRIQRGGNYGWSVTEGSHPFLPQRKKGPTPILPPIVEYNHTEGRSVTGGFVYHGSRLKDLVGAYIYGDYDTGRVWGLRMDRSRRKVTWHQELVDTSLRLVGFGEDQAGELYLVDHMGGGIHRLIGAETSTETSEFPRQLSQTGLFASTADHVPAAGLIPYSINAPMWIDGADKERFLALPGDSKIEFDALEFPQPAPGVPHGWKFPNGTVIVETISLEMEKGNPSSRRRLETRILHHERLAGTKEVGDQYWQGYTYVWNDRQTDAVLLEDPNGLDRTFTISDPDAPGGKLQQTWHFHSRAECSVCHNMAAKFVLGINTLQMNKDHDYGGVVANQLSTLEHLGLFTEPLPRRPQELPRLVSYADKTQPLDRRARSYLHANCAHCHRKWGGGNSEFRLLYPLNLAETKAVGARPGQGTFHISNARVLAPGDPYRSVLFYRMAKLGTGRMPRIGSRVVDERGLRLIHDWIEQLPANTGDGENAEVVARLRAEAVSALNDLRTHGGASADVRAKQIDRLLASTGAALRLLQAVSEQSLTEPIRNEVIARATKHPASYVRDLFERFLPEAQRTKRLGSVIKPEEILALPGDMAHGKQIFFEAAGLQCKNCHRIDGKGTELGPDLSQIGKKYNRAELLDTILNPSKVIDPKFAAYLLETTKGRVYTGLLVKKTADEVVLKDSENKLVRLRAAEVELLIPQQKSLMPELLLRDMTAREVADLTAYLNSLK